MVETFKEATNNDIDVEIKILKQPYYSNLSEREQKALKELNMRDGIVITNGDKEGAVVTLDVNGYVKECERQLNNTENYKHLQRDPRNNELVHNVIKKIENEKLIRKKFAEGLKINSPRTPRFYMGKRETQVDQL